MPQTKTEELTQRVRESRFGRDILAPKVAQPVARWLEENFGEDAGSSGTPDGVSGAGFEAGLEPASAGLEESEHATDRLDLDTSDLSTADVAEPAVDGADQDDPPDQADAEELGEIDLTPTSPKAFAGTMKELSKRIKDHNLVVVAAGIAFWGLLAIPAILFAIVSIAGLVLDPATVKEQVSSNLSGLPEEAQTIIGDQLEGVSGGSTGGLITGLILGIVLALWTASGAMAKLMAALNTTYGTTETRKFAKLRGTAVGLTLGGILFISSALFLLAVLPALLGSIDSVGASAATLFNWLRFPVLGLVMVVALGILYHVGPDRSTKYRPLTIGALVAMVLWIGLSGLFSIYTSTMGSYNETYGSIGGIVILLLWLFITAFVVLLGAEIHAQGEAQANRENAD